ncbi:SMI1/KNR4 family protein [Streptosporangium saharense]|uniref:SMI1/KNR4 family protein n=1 Tax=Streptosporangium saharense TaxID=1706840 RepID=UPI00332E08B7
MSTPSYDWLDLLRTGGEKILDRAYRDNPEDRKYEDRDPRRLGSTGAGEQEIAQAEERLGVTLPPSYRLCLQVANGWDIVGYGEGHLASAAEIGWLRDVDPGMAEGWHVGPPVPDEEYFVYGEEQDCCLHLRTEYIPDTLWVGEHDDGVFLLNPRVKTAEGEWEAWFMAPWMPGASRFRSFWDLMQDQYRGY